jgi:hypothetical protein
MTDPFSAGTFLTGGRMILEGIKWMVRSRQAPRSIINMSATLRPHIAPWYAVRFFGQPEKPFAIDLVSVRTIRPKGLLLCLKTDGPGGAPTGPQAVVLKGLQWTIQEKIKSSMPYQHVLFVKLDSLKGEAKIEFEFEAQFYDNRRTMAPIWVRTNSVIAVHPAQ